jgi:hypothetical protein
MVARSRKRISIRLPSVRSNQPAAAAAASPPAAQPISADRSSSTPLASSFSHRAPKASGNHDSVMTTNDTISRRGSAR